MQKTFFLKVNHDKGGWFIIDAHNLVVGRLAVEIVKRITGKLRIDYTPHLDCGDKIIVVNAEKMIFSGRKFKDKIYYHHTGYIGGLKENRPIKMFENGFAKRVLQLSVKRMLRGGPLARKQLANLYIYNGLEHPHEGQKPVLLDLSILNAKNCLNKVKV